MIKSRGELTEPEDQINLTIQFKDQSGNKIDTDSFPKISLIQPDGLTALAPTSIGVSRIDTGKYAYLFSVGPNPTLGVWNDVWLGYVNGFRLEQQFEFIINTTQIPGVEVDGYVTLGQDPGFDYSQCAIKNINKLIKSLRARLNSSGKSKSVDSYGNTVYVSCDIFSVDMLTTFLATALWDFNQVPFFTFFKFDDDCFVDQFGEILVEGATLWALASKALIERGREYQITDQGIAFSPPSVSELMTTQYGALAEAYNSKLKMIKASLRSKPLGLGMWSSTSNGSIVRMLRHRREGRIY